MDSITAPEQVPTYYLNNKDSLGYEASIFIINNYSSHYVDGDPAYRKTYAALFESLCDLPADSMALNGNLSNLLTSVSSTSLVNRNTVNDSSLLNPIDIIQNIDDALLTYRKNDLGYSYQLFLEYNLPYKVINEPINTEWRNYYSKKYSNILDTINIQNAKTIGSLFNYELHDSLKTSGLDYVAYNKDFMNYPVQSFNELKCSKSGECGDMTVLAIYQLRSLGLAAAMDQQNGSGHVWCAFIHPDGHHEAFLHQSLQIKISQSKIYRRTFSKQKNSLIYAVDKRYIPSNLSNPHFLDVTKEYTPTSNLTFTTEIPLKVAYLSKYSGNGNLFPIDWAYNKEGSYHFQNIPFGKFLYSDTATTDSLRNEMKIGNGMAYCYSKHDSGLDFPLTSPFILKEKDSIHYLIPNHNKLQTVVLTRKYPLSTQKLEWQSALKNAIFQISDDSSFTKPIDSFQFPDNIGVHEISFKINTSYRFQFARILLDKKQMSFSLAETTFKKSGIEIPHKAYSNSNIKKSLKELQDHQPLSFVEINDTKNQSIVYDFRKTTLPDELIIQARNDGNHIEAGDEYLLQYYDKTGERRSISTQVAMSKSIVFHNVPSNVLLILRNVTKGSEEMVFTYENGKQIWWP